MIIEEWIQEKQNLNLKDTGGLAKSTRIMLAWWDLSEEKAWSGLRDAMKAEADRILREKPKSIREQT